MKNFLPLILAGTALLISCAKEMDLSVQPVQEVKTYTLTIEAGKGERPDTKALNIDGNELKATWAKGEEVSVFKADALLGTLTAQADGQSTTLSGTVSGEIAKDDVLTLKFLSPDYTSQGGTLDYIAAHCDYATASVTVQSIDGSRVTTDEAHFQNQQAIVKFSLRNSDNTSDLEANPLMIFLPNQTITVTPASASSELFVAIPALSSINLSVKASVGSTLYELNKNAVTLAAGKYYSITARLTATTSVYYIERSWNETAKRVEATCHVLDSYTILAGSSSDEHLLPGWYVVKGSNVEYDKFLYMNGDGEYHLILCDGASLKAKFFIVNSPNVLHIHGQVGDSGKMINTYGDPFWSIQERHAGIGASYASQNGPIVIHGGDIDVHGGVGAAGIGGSNVNEQDGSITIYGGTVRALGGYEDGESGGGAGIGGGWGGDCTIVTIYGGSVYATGNGVSSGGAGIGSGHYGEAGGTITIYGGYVEATGYDKAAGIGGGYASNGGNVTIYGGTVKAYGHDGGPGIGAGQNDGERITYAGTLTVTGGTVYAYGSTRGAGIGGGWNTDGSSVTISGGYVYAEGGDLAAGIGSGCEYITGGQRHGGSLTVTGGYVEAHAGEDGAGIGGGEDAYGGNVTITGGEVRAYGSPNGTTIGAGEDGGSNGSLTLGDLLMVRPAFGEGWFAPVAADQRVNTCRNHTGVWIQLCNHPEHTPENCPYHKHP